MLLKTLLSHPFRVTGRLAWLGGELLLAAFDYAIRVSFRQSGSLHLARAQWLQRGCRRVVRVFNVTTRVAGPVPIRGLLVSNHLSYLDILVLGSVAPATFVAKREVRSWPVFGWFARLAGTVFVHRECRREVARSAKEINQALENDSLVVLFPEGTSSGGEAVLPFKSALLAPAGQRNHPLAASGIGYTLDAGNVVEEVCYWRDMTFVPHLLNLLGKHGVLAHVSFTPIEEGARNRKALARQLHSEVVRLKESYCV